MLAAQINETSGLAIKPIAGASPTILEARKPTSNLPAQWLII
jgi:hypothetical protein